MSENTVLSGTVPVFFSADDNYLPFLAVALRSLIDHADPSRRYEIWVLHDGMSGKGRAALRAMQTRNVRVGFCDLSDRLAPLLPLLSLRDYYTPSIWSRLFIPSLFTGYEKAVYIDADIVLLDDVAALYDQPLSDALLGAVTDEVVDDSPVFRAYAEQSLGLRRGQYFNSGVLVMNLGGLRRFGIEERFLQMLTKCGPDTIAPDQDYLNFLCRGRVRYLDGGWDKMSTDEAYDGTPSLIHYNMFAKPWRYDGVPYERYFWQVADRTAFAGALHAMHDAYTDEQRRVDAAAGETLVRHTQEILARGDTFLAAAARLPQETEWEDEQPDDEWLNAVWVG